MRIDALFSSYIHKYCKQGLSQDLETRCLKLAIKKECGHPIF